MIPVEKLYSDFNNDNESIITKINRRWSKEFLVNRI